MQKMICIVVLIGTLFYNPKLAMQFPAIARRKNGEEPIVYDHPLKRSAFGIMLMWTTTGADAPNPFGDKKAATATGGTGSAEGARGKPPPVDVQRRPNK